ncbi:MAG: AmmeMemoRadiSam system protein B [Alphaproteobacteria bacterium]|nr:AmmeMemoRadiSam system protein B [Alphaproteobacteria bacterium]
MEINRKKIPTYLMIFVIVAIVVIFNISYLLNYISTNNEKIVDYSLSDEDINPIREMAVAGLFYPADMYQLDSDINGYLEHVVSDLSVRPQIVIVPHAGYRYSAQVAAHAYKRLQPFKDKIKKVFLLGPSHQVWVNGVALSPAKQFKTPLGLVKTDEQIILELAKNKLFKFNAKAHLKEHSLEVQLPFLQKTLDNFTIIPLLYGEANPEEIAKILEPYLEGDSSILIASADLSHYLDYATAKKVDEQTSKNIEGSLAITHHQSCGATAVNTAMILAKKFGLVPRLLDMANSGDVSNDKNKVVGYGSWVYENTEDDKVLEGIELEQKHLQNFARHNKKALVEVVKTALDRAVNQNEYFQPERMNFNNVLFDKGASFVTLEKKGKLRGCIGSVVANKAIAVDLANNTYAAALNDSRFTPVTPDELKDISFTIALLTNFEEIQFDSVEDLLSKIKVDVDGLLIQDGERQGLFLPAVWKQIPDKQEFLTELKIKAGLSPSYWSDRVKMFRFRTVEIKNDNN